MISIILFVFAAILNAITDVLDFHYSKSIFTKCKNSQWINPALSWKNKWKNGDPNQGEKFLGSSTIFVFVTDLWHLCKFLMMLLIVFAIVFYSVLFSWWIDLIILFAIYFLIFELFFSKIFVKR